MGEVRADAAGEGAVTEFDLSDPQRKPRWWTWLPVWAAATVLYAYAVHMQIGVPLRYSLPMSAVYYFTLAALMLPVGAGSRRLIAARPPRLVLVAAHMAMAALTIAVWQAVVLAYYRYTIGPAYWQLVFERNWIFQLFYAMAIYGMALGVMLTADAWRRERERERREAELTVAARDAELLAIKAQFQPHFVLNALNSLLALIDADPALARTMVVRLADLMKAVFDRIDAPHVPLDRELELVRAYLDVERIRLGPRLTVAFEIDDAARGVLVPPFVLQPLVENAVKHGVSPFARPGLVRVSARVDGERVRVTIADSGAAAPTISAAPASSSTGRGLQLTRRRLDTVYGGGYSLTFDRQPGSGTAVHLDRPVAGAHAA